MGFCGNQVWFKQDFHSIYVTLSPNCCSSFSQLGSGAWNTEHRGCFEKHYKIHTLYASCLIISRHLMNPGCYCYGPEMSTAEMTICLIYQLSPNIEDNKEKRHN